MKKTPWILLAGMGVFAALASYYSFHMGMDAAWDACHAVIILRPSPEPVPSMPSPSKPIPPTEL